MKALVDSNLLLYLQRQSHPILFDAISHAEVVTSQLIIAELSHWPDLSARETRFLQQLWRHMPVLELTPVTFDIAAALRQQKVISVTDALLAATALTYQVELWTADTEIFRYIPDLLVRDPLVPARRNRFGERYQ